MFLVSFFLIDLYYNFVDQTLCTCLLCILFYHRCISSVSVTLDVALHIGGINLKLKW